MFSLAVSSSLVPTVRYRRAARNIKLRSAGSVRCHLSSGSDLNDLNRTARRLEDQIVFNLLERTIYSAHQNAYTPDGRLRDVVFEIERAHAVQGGFSHDDEQPFMIEALFDRPVTVAKPPSDPFLDPIFASMNINHEVWRAYLRFILPALQLKSGDDGLIATALACDAACLRAMSKRVHLSKYFAEMKFRKCPEKFIQAARAKDRLTLEELLSCNEPEEEEGRYQRMARATNDSEVASVGNLYSSFIFPLAKKMEGSYLLAKVNRTA